MNLRNAAAVIVVLAATTVWAQGSSPVTASPTRTVTGSRPTPVGRRARSPLMPSNTAEQTPATLHQKMLDMEGTLRQMHAVAQLMHAKAASSSKDSLAKANVDMWDLLLGHLDKQFAELKTATIARDELEARRAALYKQADEKAAAAAEAAKSSASSQPATPGAPAQGAGQVPAAQPAAGQTAPSPASNPSNSPN